MVFQNRAQSMGAVFVCDRSPECMPASYKPGLLLRTHCAQALPVQLQQTSSVVFRLGGGAGALKSHARRSSASVSGGHGDEFHQIECDVFVAARVARACGGNFVHESFSSSGNNG